MIVGALRGVIASSWLRASDQLRAPNAITTGQDIPQVEVVVRQEPRAEILVMLFPATMLRISQPNRVQVGVISCFGRPQPNRVQVGVISILKRNP